MRGRGTLSGCVVGFLRGAGRDFCIARPPAVRLRKAHGAGLQPFCMLGRIPLGYRPRLVWVAPLALQGRLPTASARANMWTASISPGPDPVFANDGPQKRWRLSPFWPVLGPAAVKMQAGMPELQCRSTPVRAREGQRPGTIPAWGASPRKGHPPIPKGCKPGPSAPVRVGGDE